MTTALISMMMCRRLPKQIYLAAMVNKPWQISHVSSSSNWFSTLVRLQSTTHWRHTVFSSFSRMNPVHFFLIISGSTMHFFVSVAGSTCGCNAIIRCKHYCTDCFTMFSLPVSSYFLSPLPLICKPMMVPLLNPSISELISWYTHFLPFSSQSSQKNNKICTFLTILINNMSTQPLAPTAPSIPATTSASDKQMSIASPVDSHTRSNGLLATVAHQQLAVLNPTPHQKKKKKNGFAPCSGLTCSCS